MVTPRSLSPRGDALLYSTPLLVGGGRRHGGALRRPSLWRAARFLRWSRHRAMREPSLPTFADAWTNLANAYTRKGNLNQAAECCHQALALNLHLADAYCNRGDVLKAQGLYTLFLAAKVYLGFFDSEVEAASDGDGKVTPEEVAAANYLKDTVGKEGVQELISNLSKDKEGKILVEDIVKLSSQTGDNNEHEETTRQ
ncbi:hypothetical protein ABZP36_002958 [Zizania latifolia]